MCRLYLVMVMIMIAGEETMADCDRQTGPAGITECFLGTPYYSRYQCGTCLTNVYIQQRSSGRHECRDSTATYCYYQCMIERYGLDNGPVYDDCLCDAASSLPQPSVILPADCYSPDGTDCGWYKRCLSARHPCTGHQAEYAVSYGEKFCDLYTQSFSEFSSEGQKWIDAVRRCLQVALVPLLHLCQVATTCDDISKTAFNSHVPCYVNPYRGFSVCLLPVGDWITIFWTIKSSFVGSAFLETMKASLLTAYDCGEVYSQQLGSYLYAVGLRIWNNTIGKRAAEKQNDDEKAHNVMLYISNKLKWQDDATVDWYVFATNRTNVNTTAMTSSNGQQDTLQMQLFIVDRVDIGLMSISDAVGRRRLDDVITQFADVINQGLSGSVSGSGSNFQFRVTSLRQCANETDINSDCRNGNQLATAPMTSATDVTSASMNIYFLSLMTFFALISYQ